VPQVFKVTMPDGNLIKLGIWLLTQRTQYRKGILNKDKLRLLQALVDKGELYWNASEFQGRVDESWRFYYELLIEYGRSHNHEYNVPHTYIVDGTNYALGSWLGRQRRLYYNGDLLDDRLELLQDLVDHTNLLWDASKLRGKPKYV